jgi:HEAT repeat protein/thioredoxin-related protein
MNPEYKISRPGGGCATGLTRYWLPALLAVFILTVAVAEPAAGPSFHPTFKAASDAAAADQSLVLLIFGAEWCGPCRELKNKTLSSPEFSQQGDALQIAEVDIDANQKMAHDFAIEAVPTLVLLTADGKIVARQTGFLDPAGLLLWLQEGRGRAAAGQWEGAAPGVKFDEFIRKAAADNLNTNDIQRLVDLLGDPDPANRGRAGKILLAQRDLAVPPLIEAVDHPYLGVRISASELLQRLASDIAPIDPWQSPAELSNTVVVLKKWWAETGRLPPVAVPRAADSATGNSIKEALEQLRGDDPVRCTEAMAMLVGHGTEALPAVREAIQRAERAGDQRVIGLLEDVRWAILVPDTVEQRTSGIRHVLARGKSSERQAATERLRHAGHDALGALAELAMDSDPLVVEGAVRALPDLGGKETIPALAALLQAADSNLRMTAAQALGHTKNSDAIKPLLTVIDDPNEVVACTALAALEEIQSRDSYGTSKESPSGELVAGLKQGLADPRWRVRAATAEAVGKMNAGELAGDVKKLLEDSDGFVVKSALTALGELHAAPDPDQLAALGKRLPSLQGDAVEMMLQSETDETVKQVADLFKTGSVASQLTILHALTRSGTSDEKKSDNEWKPLLAQAAAATDPRLRRGAAEAMGGRSPKLAVELVGPLLADEDRETRLAAAEVVLGILGRDNGVSPDMQMSSSTKTNKPLATAGRIASWHTAMLQHVGSDSNLNFAAAVFATGDGKADLPVLLASLEQTGVTSDQSRQERRQDSAAIGLVMSKLPWPEGRPVLDSLAGAPLWFALAAHNSDRARPEVADYLLEPARFKSTVEPADGQTLLRMLELLAGYEYSGNRGWSLWAETDRTKAVALALIESTNAAWRTAAVFSLGLRADAGENLAIFDKALLDSNAWVRGSAVRALARNTKERAVLEQRLAPSLADTNVPVAATAALALLEPEIRRVAELDSRLNNFEYESTRGGRSESYNQQEERPLITLEGKPAFLQLARERLSATKAEDSVAFALLLAQYGEFDGLDRLVAQRAALDSANEQAFTDALLTGIALSRDTRYLPVLRQIAAARRNEWKLRKVLQALKGMTGPDARQLRLEINRRMRNAGGSSALPSE